MKLWIGAVALHDLGHLQMLGQSSTREPAEAPQRERRTVRVRLEFFEQTYRNNFALVESVRGALKTPATTLRWEDDSGFSYLERWVILGDDTQPEDNAQGTYRQSIEFSFYYYVHNLTTNCLPATLTRQPAGAEKDLGAVLKWQESLDVDHFDDMRDPRRRVFCTLTAAGRLQGNTLASLTDCRDALLTLKAALLDEIVAGSSFRLKYGAGTTQFNKIIRVKRFTADVDQPHAAIDWSLQATFTRFPDENDYAWLDYTVQTRETKAEGIVALALRGRIGASSRTRANTALATLTTGPGGLVPAGYLQVSEDLTEHNVQSSDGTAWLELLFDLEWRDTTTLGCTLKKAGGTALDLGVVERFADRYTGQLFDELRPQRRRAGGTLTAAGRLFAADSLTLAQKQSELIAKKAAFDTLLNANKELVLTYGTAFEQTLRITEWECQINRLRNCLEWALSGTYTRYPNEANYTITEFRAATRENKADGTSHFSLTGRIGAPTATAARTRLAQLRASTVPAGYTLLNEETTENSVSARSNDNGDGDTFIELNFNDDWQKTSADLLSWSLRITDLDDVRSSYVRTTYSGSVTAQGSTSANAYATAAAQAATLGADKYEFLTSSTLTRNDKLSVVAGEVLVTVDFNYEYLRQITSDRLFLEVNAERSRDSFGQTTESVSGTITAKNLAAAQAFYLTEVRTPYGNGLVLSERLPTRSAQVLNDTELFERYAFSLTLLLAKAAADTALEYQISTQTNWQSLEIIRTITGRIVAADETTANSYLDDFLAGLALGTHCGQSSRRAAYSQGPKATGADKATVFTGLDFSENYCATLTGEAGVLECECTEQIRYSGKRLVEKPLPGGPSLFQHTGTTPAQRIVSGRVRAVTELACLAWARKCRELLISTAATYEEAPVITTTFRFAPRLGSTDPVFRGESNVQVFETNFTFQEFVPELPFV